MLKFLLLDYMRSHPDVYKRMIAAYVVDQSITPRYLAQNPHLRFGTGPADTGVILSWNTKAPVVDGTNPASSWIRRQDCPCWTRTGGSIA
jgi:hypothetical protein